MVLCVSANAQIDSVQTDSPQSNKAVEFIQKVIPDGNIGVGYEYGFLPFLVGLNPPEGNFKTEGNFGIKLWKVPLRASFYYSNLGSISGLNNHFTIRFDESMFSQNIQENLEKQKDQQKEQINGLNTQKQQLKSKLDYLYMLDQGKISVPKTEMDSLLTNRFIDTTNAAGLNYTNQDSLGMENPDLYSLNQDIGLETSGNISNSSEYNQDSISTLIDQYESKLDGVEQSLEYCQKIDQSVDYQLDGQNIDTTIVRPQGLGWVDKVEKVLGGVKKFDVGMTYPTYSAFLVSRIPVRGVDIEYQYEKVNVCFTHGKTVNNIFFTNNIVENKLVANRNLYNYFDFNNIDEGRKITAIKLGYGAKKESHILIGALKGLGKTSYLDHSVTSDTESNLVAEIDVRYKLKKHYVDLIYGRSSLQVNSINFESEDVLLNNLLDFNQRTNAILTSYGMNLGSTDLKLTLRYIDPYFKSFGLGFVRSDNVRYEIKAKQKVGKKVTIGGYYRRENDNILGIYNYQNIISSYGGNLAYRPFRGLLLKVDYRPIVQQVNSQVDTMSIINENYIINSVVSYSTRIKKTFFFFTGIFSHYQLSTMTSYNTYQNLNINMSIQYQDILVNDLIYNRYVTSDSLSVPLASIIADDLTLNLAKLSLTIMAKASFRQNEQFDWGGGVRITIPISKVLSVEASGEKLVFGDFYNSIFQENLADFPYYTQASIRIKW